MIDLKYTLDWRGTQSDYFWGKNPSEAPTFSYRWKSACVSLRNFCSVLRRKATLRGASAMTDLITQHFFLWKNLHILRTPNFQKNTLVGQVWLFRSFPNNYEGSYKFVKEHTSVFLRMVYKKIPIARTLVISHQMERRNAFHLACYLFTHYWPTGELVPLAFLLCSALSGHSSAFSFWTHARVSVDIVQFYVLFLLNLRQQ